MWTRHTKVYISLFGAWGLPLHVETDVIKLLQKDPVSHTCVLAGETIARVRIGAETQELPYHRRRRGDLPFGGRIQNCSQVSFLRF